MARTILSRSVSLMTLALLAAALTVVGQPTSGGDGKGPVREMAKKVKGGRRLPAHYARVVTPEQREKIYKIQAEYQPRIEALQEQLNALKQERDEKIAAVLTPEQKKQIEEAKAKSKKKPPQPAPAKPAEPAPAIPPAKQ